MGWGRGHDGAVGWREGRRQRHSRSRRNVGIQPGEGQAGRGGVLGGQNSVIPAGGKNKEKSVFPNFWCFPETFPKIHAGIPNSGIPKKFLLGIPAAPTPLSTSGVPKSCSNSIPAITAPVCWQESVFPNFWSIGIHGNSSLEVAPEDHFSQEFRLKLGGEDPNPNLDPNPNPDPDPDPYPNPDCDPDSDTNPNPNPDSNPRANTSANPDPDPNPSPRPDPDTDINPHPYILVLVPVPILIPILIPISIPILVLIPIQVLVLVLIQSKSQS